MKKIFGGVNLTWPKLIIMAIVLGVYTAIMAMLPIARDTSFTDLAVTFEVWIFFGIFIIMNSKSAFDSALKCFVFFLISQPLIYLVQDVVNGSQLFVLYYRNWVPWTIACLPMGFIGYYMKKDQWWGLLILVPILGLLGVHYNQYLSKVMFSFPRHFLTVLFCAITLILYPVVIFHNKIARRGGVLISTFIILVASILCFLNPFTYSTDLLLSSEEHYFDDTYQVYFLDSNYGDVSLKYESVLDCWMIHADLKREGKTELVLVSPDGHKRTFEITIRDHSYDIEEKEDSKE